VADDHSRHARVDRRFKWDQVACLQLLESQPNGRRALLRGLVGRSQAGEVGDRAEHVLRAVGRDGGTGVGRHLLWVVGVEPRPERRAALLADVHDRAEHAGQPQAAQRGRRLPSGVAGLAGGSHICRQGGRGQIRERVELAALLARHHPRRHVVRLARDHRRLARETPELRRIRVVLAGDHDAAEVEPPQPAEDLGGELRPPEAEQEQLRHLALHRQSPRQVGHAARHRGPLAAPLALRGGRHDSCEKRDPFLRSAATRGGHVRGAA
jgi:hypothetical protein